MSNYYSSGDLAADRRYQWGLGASADKDYAAAADLFAQTLELAPQWAPAWFALGEALERLGRRDEAVAALTKAASFDAEGALAADLHLARLGAAATPSTAPAAYVRTLFDQYARTFDAHLTGALAYRGPEILLALAHDLAPERRFERALDLGCGAGLAGAAFRSRVGFLSGVDLSPNMVEAARGKNLYDALATADLLAFLHDEREASADLAVAADVFVYIGDLSPIFAACARVLQPGGLFLFTTQEADNGDVRIGADLRYAHSARYIEAVAARSSLAVRRLDRVSTRKEAGKAVPGLAAALWKS